MRRLRRPRAGVNLDCFSAGGPVVPSPVTDEQAALRRVATLIARAAQPPAVFAAVAEEVGRLLPADRAFVVRYLRVERPAKGGTLVAADIPPPGLARRSGPQSLGPARQQAVARTVAALSLSPEAVA